MHFVKYDCCPTPPPSPTSTLIQLHHPPVISLNNHAFFYMSKITILNHTHIHTHTYLNFKYMCTIKCTVAGYTQNGSRLAGPATYALKQECISNPSNKVFHWPSPRSNILGCILQMSSHGWDASHGGEDSRLVRHSVSSGTVFLSLASRYKIWKGSEAKLVIHTFQFLCSTEGFQGESDVWDMTDSVASLSDIFIHGFQLLKRLLLLVAVTARFTYKLVCRLLLLWSVVWIALWLSLYKFFDYCSYGY